MSITSPQRWDILTSPVTVKGTGSAFEGDVGTLYVLDHLYTAIGHAKGVPANNGKTTFMATVPYTASFHGTQEGVLAYYTYSQADGAIASVVMLKVLVAA
jgi:Immunoglobulin-like domain of bacterial spore germination